MENIGNINIDTSNHVIQSSKNIFCESFYFIDIYDEGNTKKFIKNTERIIRRSKEYNKYIEVLRREVGILNYDSVQSNISCTDAPLEFHHYPLTLYDIVSTVLNYHIMNQDKVTSFSIAKEVMELHFKNQIGLVSLTSTNHQLEHLSSIFINKKQIFGNYREFLDKYKNGLTMEMIDKVKKLDDMSENNIAIDFKGIL